MKLETTTSANPLADDYRSPDEIVKAVMEFAKGPKLIGNLMGLLVYVDNSVPPGQVQIHHKGGRVQTFSVDHPYIKGTKLEDAARRALASGETAT
jgi:hypothetical protein